MPRRDLPYFSHPLRPEDITEENYTDIAQDLFDRQRLYTVEYFAQTLAYGYGDDDTDYMTTCLDANATLLAISYDGTSRDLIDFLFMRREIYQTMTEHPQMELIPTHMPLHAIDSAGGLCDALQTYTPEED